MPQDEALLLAIYGSTRKEELSRVPHWTEAQKEAFIAQQFHAQDDYYKKVYPNADYDIILQSKEPAGRLYVERRLVEGTIRIIDIALLPQFRSQGIGESLLLDLQEEARQAGKTLSIHVEQFNRALNLYKRLGFDIIHETHGVYLFMEWKPS